MSLGAFPRRGLTIAARVPGWLANLSDGSVRRSGGPGSPIDDPGGGFRSPGADDRSSRPWRSPAWGFLQLPITGPPGSPGSGGAERRAGFQNPLPGPGWRDAVTLVPVSDRIQSAPLGRCRPSRLNTSTAPSHSVRAAARTARPQISPSVATCICRLRPETFFPPSYPSGSPLRSTRPMRTMLLPSGRRGRVIRHRHPGIPDEPKGKTLFRPFAPDPPTPGSPSVLTPLK
jgi:hypothetical protein